MIFDRSEKQKDSLILTISDKFQKQRVSRFLTASIFLMIQVIAWNLDKVFQIETTWLT